MNDVMESPGKMNRAGRWLLNRWEVIVILLTFVFALLAALILFMFFVRAFRPLPYSFTSKVYAPTPDEVCPGDRIEWQHVVHIEGESVAILSPVWIDPRTGKAVAPASLGDAQLFSWRSHGYLQEYYDAAGRDVTVGGYPLTITRTLTATVPAVAPYDAPLALDMATVIGSPAQYSVPVWVLPEEDCQ